MMGESVLVYIVNDEPRIELAQYNGDKDWYINEEYINSIVYNSIKFWMRLPDMPYASRQEVLAIQNLRSIAENPCLCDMGCPRCDAIETLQEMGITL